MERRERTEGEILDGSSIEVSFGGKAYQIAPLVIKESRKWRKKFVEVFNELIGSFGKELSIEKLIGNPSYIYESLEKAGLLLGAAPDSMLDLLLEYSPELEREEIESRATEREVFSAFKGVVGLAFPFLNMQDMAGILTSMSGSPKGAGMSGLSQNGS